MGRENQGQYNFSKKSGLVFFWVTWFGALLSGFSLTHAIFRVLDIGMSEFIGELFENYRTLMHPLLLLVRDIKLPFVVNYWMIDLLIVYICLFSVSIRVGIIHRKYAWAYGENYGKFKIKYIFWSVVDAIYLKPIAMGTSFKKFVTSYKSLIDQKRQSNPFSRFQGPALIPLLRKYTGEQFKNPAYSEQIKRELREISVSYTKRQVNAYLLSCLQILLLPIIVILLFILNFNPVNIMSFF